MRFGLCPSLCLSDGEDPQDQDRGQGQHPEKDASHGTIPQLANVPRPAKNPRSQRNPASAGSRAARVAQSRIDKPAWPPAGQQPHGTPVTAENRAANYQKPGGEGRAVGTPQHRIGAHRTQSWGYGQDRKCEKAVPCGNSVEPASRRPGESPRNARTGETPVLLALDPAAEICRGCARRLWCRLPPRQALSRVLGEVSLRDRRIGKAGTQ